VAIFGQKKMELGCSNAENEVLQWWLRWSCVVEVAVTHSGEAVTVAENEEIKGDGVRRMEVKSCCPK